MKNHLFLMVGLVVFFLGCSKTTIQNQSVCESAGYYETQDSCLMAGGNGNCNLITGQYAGVSKICYQKAQPTPQPSPGGTIVTDPCAPGNPAPNWVVSAWSPAACAPNVVSQSRVVNCPYSCACAGAAPATTQTCSGDLYGSNHYSSQCTSGGGSVILLDAKKGCLFQGASCPSGWSPLSNGSAEYTATMSTSYVTKTGCLSSARRTDLTGYHTNIAAIAVETAQKCSSWPCPRFSCQGYETVRATVTKVVCY